MQQTTEESAQKAELDGKPMERQLACLVKKKSI